jgi:hypothetical protein
MTQIPEGLVDICFQAGQAVLDSVPQDVEINTVVGVPQLATHAPDVAPRLVSAPTPALVRPTGKPPRKCVPGTARRRHAEADRLQRPHGLTRQRSSECAWRSSGPLNVPQTPVQRDMRNRNIGVAADFSAALDDAGPDSCLRLAPQLLLPFER